MEELIEKNPGNTAGYNTWQDKLYALQQISKTVIGLAYNKDMFVEAGIVDENGEKQSPLQPFQKW